MNNFRAFRIHNEEGRHRAAIEQVNLAEPGAGELLIRSHYSSVNFKDALAGTGKGKILRQFPLTGGIDSSGVVVRSKADGFREGDQVLVTGCGMSASHDGGYAEYLRIPAGWAIPLPEGLSLSEAMALGTAGFTAALALQRMEDNGQTPETGPLLVNGASGGVGSIAVELFANQGYQVIAVSAKRNQHDYLKQLGASETVTPDALPTGKRPLEKALWGGALDTVGGDMLSNLARHIRPWGNIASIGLAGGTEFCSSVMPFILRGISLLGINSADTPHDLRLRIWQRLASDLKPRHLDTIVTRVISLDQLADVFEEMLAGRTHGRILVELKAGRQIR